MRFGGSFEAEMKLHLYSEVTLFFESQLLKFTYSMFWLHLETVNSLHQELNSGTTRSSSARQMAWQAGCPGFASIVVIRR